ncbi:MAG: site-specific integrase [Alistipes sp.]|nr:site-specific integrase [Alistipes sp.]
MNITIEAVLYTSKTLSNGLHPLMLRLTKDRKRKYISLHVSLNAQHWDSEKCKPRRHCPNKSQIEQLIRQQILHFEQKALEFQLSGREFTLDSLCAKSTSKTSRHTVGDFLDRHIEELLHEDRIGNAKTFKELRTSLQNFSDSLDFHFSEMNANWLQRYEHWLRIERRYCGNSISIRMRSLRTLYNRAIDEGLVRRDKYPFDQIKVGRLREDTAKRSLTKEDVLRVIRCDTSGLTKYPTPFMQLAKDLFVFSYLSCGMNLTDMLHIRYGDINEGRLSYIRQKTGKRLSVQLQPEAITILQKYKKPTATPKDYIFPVLDCCVHLTPLQQYERIQRANKRVNRWLKVIGEHLNLPIPLTTYVARHTFATVLKRSGVSTAIISESLGHCSERVTQIYLDSFENEQINEAMQHLL